ncbi:hypothetical protein OF001_U30092 [Pseudomonas sp. OF001]|nr:hypothetical protein OF001_U30092 [Pseudomonas sp. OF001]
MTTTYVSKSKQGAHFPYRIFSTKKQI